MYYHLILSKGNILVDSSQTALLCDFGLARILLDEGSSGMTTTTAHVGTERYLAPELVSGEDLEYPTTASDIYAVGCLGLEVSFMAPGSFENLTTLDYSSYSVESPTLTVETICAGGSSMTLAAGCHHPRSQRI
jgi:serine/threonine protein kinase